jgi:DNA-binding response OmpR family regulator
MTDPSPKPALPSLMLIDDDSVIRATLQAALEKEYDLVAFPNGERILQEIEKHKPLLLILDINMPGSDGFGICEKVRAQARLRNMPILFMTARKDDATFLKSLQTGGDAFINKPFEMPELKERIEYLLKASISP